MKSISIIIPTYNDEKIILKKINIISKKLKKTKLNYEIIIINDGSCDDTLKKVMSFNSKKIKLINNKTNRGKSYSIIKGLRKSKFKHVILIDSDLPYFNKFNFILKKLKENYDFIFIDRRHANSKLISKKKFIYVSFRSFLSYFLSIILFFFLNQHENKIDTQAGLKGLKKINNFKKFKFISVKFFLDVELLNLYIKRKKKILSVPVTYKISNKSSIKFYNITQILKIFYELVRVIFFITFNKKI